MNIKEKLADAHNNFPMIDSHPALLYAEALNEIVELEKDKSRLDWLANLDNKIGNVQLPMECIISGIDGGLRGAIDEAMGIEQ